MAFLSQKGWFRVFIFTLLASPLCFAFHSSKLLAKPPLTSCTPEAASLAKIHKRLTHILYPSNSESEEQILSPYTKTESPVWKKRVSRVISQLKSYGTPSWWNIPVANLQACLMTDGKSRAVNLQKKEGVFNLMGDDHLRLIILSTPYGDRGLFNAFLLAKINGTTPVLHVIDRFVANADWPIDMVIVRTPPVAVVNAWWGGLSRGLSLESFWINTVSGQLEPYPLFQKEKVKNSKVWFIGNVCDPDQPEHCPPLTNEKGEDSFISKNGTFVDSVFIYTKEAPFFQIGLWKWMGEAYEFNYTRDAADKLLHCREVIKAKMNELSFQETDLENCRHTFPCEMENDESALLFRKGKYTEAQEKAEQALSDCKGYNPQEYKASQFNHNHKP